MPENPSGGTTHDSVALLKQLIRSAAKLARGQEKQKQEISRAEGEVRALPADAGEDTVT